MSKYVIVEQPPKKLETNEFVIDSPDFYSFIAKARGKKPRSNELTVNYLREIVQSIGQHYIGETFDTLGVNLSRYIGIPCVSDADIHNTLMKIFDDQCPTILYKTVEEAFKTRPSKVNTIYYTGDPKYSTKLMELGWQQQTQKEFDSQKVKKIVDKPTITAQ